MVSGAVATTTNSTTKFVAKRGKEYKPMKTSMRYLDSVRISPATNRPIKEGEAVGPKIDVYWCEPCKTKLTNPLVVLAHITSRFHTEKVNTAQKMKDRIKEDMKRKQSRDTGAAKSAKVAKRSSTPRGRGGASTSRVRGGARSASNYFDSNRRGFNFSRDHDNVSYASYPQSSYVRGNDNFSHRPFGNNLMMQQQSRQQFGSGLFNNMDVNQQHRSLSNHELLQARLLRNNQSGFGDSQGQSSGGSFWR